MNVVSALYARVVDHPTGSGWRIPALDGLRGIAALMVLVAHSMGAAEDPNFASPAFAFLQRGGLGGVMLFFALSGFLLYLPWLRSTVEGTAPPRFAKYAARRCLRIMPAYYASVVLLAILRVLVAGRDPIPASDIFLHFVFLPTLGQSLLTVYWSLQVEEFFYWMLPMMHRLVVRIGIAALVLGATVVSAAWAFAAFGLPYEQRANWLQQTPFFLPAFALGILTAVVWQRWRVNRLAHWFVIGGAAGYVVLSPVAQMMEAYDSALVWVGGLAMAPLASLVVLGVAQGGAESLRHPLLRFVGGISFSLYLWHMVVIRNAPTPEWVAHSFPLRLVYVAALALPVAVVFFLTTERPFLLLRPRASVA